MALRSLGRAGVEMGARVAGKGSRGLGGGVSHRTRQLAGAERSLSSSFVGEGQGQFGSSQAPSYRQGSSGAGPQLFKLVETDLMSKELTRYGPSDAEHLGLHSIQDVLSEIAAATLAPQEPAAPIATAIAPSVEVVSVSASVQEESAAAPAAPEEEVLAAWGLGPVVKDNSEADGLQASAVGEVEEEEEGVSNEKMAIKRTYQPSTLKRKRKHGFLYRAKTRLGKKIMQRRRDKGRWRIGI